MINTYKHKKIVWVDLESPTKEEVKEVMDTYNIHPLIAQELLVSSLKSKVDLYKDFIYLILHFPAIRQSHSKAMGSSQEIDFVIGQNFIITTRYDTVDPLHEFAKIFEVDSILDKSHLGDHAGFLFYQIIKHLYRGTGNELDVINDSLKEIEKQVFSGKEQEMVFALSKIGRELLIFKNTLALHKDVLESFEVAGTKFFKGDFSHYLRAITSEYYKLASLIQNLNETMDELRETNNSLLSTKQNSVMQNLTIFAFITLPISLILALFQIDAKDRPIIGSNHDFWILVIILLIIAAGLFAFFRHRKWL